jgi:uncharacterized protein involved in exopolysaccharide biosynthesis
MNENVRILNPLFRGFPIIILVMILSVLAAKKYLSYVNPTYESTAKLKLADTEEGLSSANLFKDLDVFASVNKIATEIEVLKSSKLIKKTLDELPFKKEIYRKGKVLTVELFNNSPITVEGTFLTEKALDKRYLLNVISKNEYQLFYPDSTQGIPGQLGQPLKIEGSTLLIGLNKPFIQSKENLKVIDTYEFEFLSTQKLVAQINKNLDIASVDKDVPVIRISMKSYVPEKAALFVNKLAEMYIRDYIESKFLAANTTVDFLKEEINRSNKKLIASENNIKNFKDQKNIVNIKQETETDLRKISELKIVQANLKMNLDAIKALNLYIASGKENYLELAPNFEAFTDLLSTEMVKNMKKLQSDKKDLLLTYTPENEKVKIIDAKLKDLIDYQIESIKNTEYNLQTKYNVLSNDIAESEKVFIGLPEKEKQLTILNREFTIYETNYNFLNGKRIDAEVARSAKIAFHTIISAAEISKIPVAPVRSVIISVAAILGMLGSILFIYIVHFAKAKVNDEFTIEKNSTIPIALATPFITIKETVKDHFLKEAIQMELKGMLQNQSILVISSFDQPEEHLFHSEHLAEALKHQGRKVLVIDVTGELEGKLDQKNDLSFSDSKYQSLTKTVLNEQITKKMQDFDLCIIHNQSIKEDKLGLLFMSVATQNLIVLDSRKTAEKTIVKIELLKDEFQLPNVWFVLNKAGYNPSILAGFKKLWNSLQKQVFKI